MTEPRAASEGVATLLEGGNYYEGARWRDGRWHVSDMFGGAVLAVDEDGFAETLVADVAHPSGLGWLPDGSLLVNSISDRRVLRRAPDGALSVHSDMAQICPYGPNDMITDERGHAWVGTTGFDLFGGEAPKPGAVYSIAPDGAARAVAEGLWSPNGIVTTGEGATLIVAETFASRLTAFPIDGDGLLGERRVFAQIGETPEPGTVEQMIDSAGLVPDGLAIDSEDHVWAADGLGGRCLRLAPDGSVVDELLAPVGLNVYACAIGGSDGHTLLMCVHPDALEAAQGRGLGEAKLLTARVAVPR